MIVSVLDPREGGNEEPNAGVQPQWIQGIRSRDGVDKERLIYLFINIRLD